MVEAAATFRKSGFGDEEAASLSRLAAMYQNVADTAVSAEDAAASITSQIRAYGVANEDAVAWAEHVINAYNEVANSFSVGTNDLSQAMEIASAGMATYGNSFNEVIGLVTAGTEIMTGRGSQVARGLQTIASRIVKNSDALAEYGIAVENTDGTLRSTYEVLKDLSEIWDALSDTERTALGEQLSGLNQYKVLTSVLQNFQTAIGAVTTAEESQGSAMRENTAYMSSLQAATSQLKSTWEAFSNSVVDSDLVKFFLGAGTSALKALNSDIGVTVAQLGLLTGVLTGTINLIGQFGTNLTAAIPALSGLAGGFASISAAAPVAAAVIAAITVAVIKGASAWRAYQEEVYGVANELNKATKEAKDNAEETVSSTEASAIVAEKYAKKIQSLQEVEELDNEQKREMAHLVETLNGIIPDLGLTIDETTGKVKEQTKTLQDNIAAWKESAKQQAYQTQIQTIVSSITNAEIELEKKKNELLDLETENEIDGIKFGEIEKTKETLHQRTELAKTIAELSKTEQAANAYEQAALAERAYETNPAVIELLDKYGDDYKKLRESIKATEQTIADSKRELSELESIYDSTFGTADDSSKSSRKDTSYQRAKAKVGSLLPEEGDEYEGRFDYDAYLERRKHYLNIGLITEQEYYSELEGMLKVFTDESIISTEKRWKAEEDIFKYKQNLAKEQEEAYEEAVRNAERAAQQEAQAQRQAIADVKSDFTAWQDEQDYLLSTGQITETEYYDRLKQKNDELFKDKEDFLSQYWTNLEKIYKWESGQIEDQFDEWQKLYQHKLNMGEITEEEYYSELKRMNEEYFANQEKYLDKYWKNEEDYYKWKKQQIEDIHEATQKALEDEIAKEKEKLELKKSAAEKRKQQLEDQQDEIEQLSDYVQAMADKEIDKIDEKITALKDEADAITAKYKEQIDALEQQNQAIDDQINKQKLLEALAKAQQTKKYVFKDGRFQYVSDVDEINEAQSQLDEFNREQALQEKTKQLEKQRDLELEQNEIQQKALEEEKKRWEEYKTGWANITKAYTDEQNALLAQQKLGIDVEKATWDERLSNLESFKNQYISLAQQIKAAEAEIAGYDTAISNADSSANQDAKIREMMKANSEAWHKTTDASERERLHEANEYLNSLLSNQGTYNAASGQWSNLSYQSASAGNSAASVFTGSPITSGALASSILTGGLKNAKQALSQIFNMGNISLPNVSNAKDFVAELKNMALQAAYSRG